jgi:hypothetical protein
MANVKSVSEASHADEQVEGRKRIESRQMKPDTVKLLQREQSEVPQ